MSLVYILIVYCPVDFFVGTLCDLDEHYCSTYHMHLVIPETKFAIIRMFIDHLDDSRPVVSRIVYRPVYQILECADIGAYRRDYSRDI